jgi:hypothetical protein
MEKRIIYCINENIFVIIPTEEIPIEEVLLKDVPIGCIGEIVSVSAIPSDHIFRNAWTKNEKNISYDINKCKIILHEKRRQARSIEFGPYDEIIMKQIPGKDLEKTELERQKIREKYEILQNQIDSIQIVDELKKIWIDLEKITNS